MSQIRICDVPREPDYVRFGEGFGQRFLLTVDTEEEFDWTAPFDRDAHTLETVPALGEFIRLCEGFGVVPVFLVDYPVAASKAAADLLKPAIAAGKAEIGVQLHPWVNPPHEESISEFNSFAGNLPKELEQAKFTELRNTIERNFGVAPRIFRCGRYGAGASTAAILAQGGVAIDTSVRSRFDYRPGGGPNYCGHPVRPYWLDRPAGLIELPLTTVYWGLLRQIGDWLQLHLANRPHLRGALSRLRLLDRIPLTPEGVTLDEAIRGIDVAIDEGLPVLVFSFHSPSLAPGHTPYVRSPDDVVRLYDWWRQVFAHLARRGVAPTSIAEIMTAAELA